MPALILGEKQQEVINYMFRDETVKECFFGGAAGPGKSFTGSLMGILMSIFYPGMRGCFGRKYREELYTTTCNTFVETWETYFADNKENIKMKYTGEGAKSITFNNGSEILLKGLHAIPSNPDFGSLSSLELSWFFGDEIFECIERAITMVMARVRYNCILINGKRVRKCLLVGNPSPNWVMERYIQDKQGNPIKLEPWQRVVLSTLKDNPNREWSDTYLQDLSETLSEYDKRRLIDGVWGFAPNDNPFFFHKERINWVTIKSRVAGLPLWISFDFNITPTSALVAQLVYGYGIYIYREYQRDNGTEVLCKEIFKHEGRQSWIITGDNSGASRFSVGGMTEDGTANTDYKTVCRIFGVNYKAVRNITGRNKQYTYSRKVTNYVLSKVPVYIDKSCTVLRYDIESAQVKDDESLIKNRNEHKQDLGDAFRYLIDAMFPKGTQDVDRFAAGINKKLIA